MEKTTADVRRFVEQVAKHNGWAVNPDDEFVSDLIEGLRVNFNRYGYFLCPCRDGTGDRSQDKDVICACVYNVPDQKEYGHCYCALFLDPQHLANGGETRPIPERRPEELRSDE